MVKKDIHVKPYDRTRFGKLEAVAYPTGGYWKQIEQIDKKLLEHLSKIKQLNIERYLETHPNLSEEIPLVFLYPNEYWRKHPDKCKVLFIDTQEAPDVVKLPELGIPGQTVIYKNKNYVAGENGKFQKIPDSREAVEMVEYEDLTKREREILPSIEKTLTEAQYEIGGELAMRLIFDEKEPSTSEIGSPAILKRLEEKGLVSKKKIKNKYIWKFTPLGKYIWREEIGDYLDDKEEQEKQYSNPVLQKSENNPTIKSKVKTLFKEPEYEKYGDIVSFENIGEAKKSSQKLRKEFNQAKTTDKKLRVLRVIQYSANRAAAATKKKDLSKKECQELTEISNVYGDVAKSMWELYDEIKD